MDFFAVHTGAVRATARSGRKKWPHFEAEIAGMSKPARRLLPVLALLSAAGCELLLFNPNELRVYVPRAIPIKDIVYYRHVLFEFAAVVFRVSPQFRIQNEKHDFDFLKTQVRLPMDGGRPAVEGDPAPHLIPWRKTPIVDNDDGLDLLIWRRIQTRQCLAENKRLSSAFHGYLNHSKGAYFSTDKYQSVLLLYIPAMDLLIVSAKAGLGPGSN